MELNLENIKKHLKKGDYQIIADRSGVSSDYVYRVLNGKKGNISVISNAQDVALENIAEINSVDEKSKKIQASV